jgi:hypothetical protein
MKFEKIMLRLEHEMRMPTERIVQTEMMIEFMNEDKHFNWNLILYLLVKTNNVIIETNSRSIRMFWPMNPVTKEIHRFEYVNFNDPQLRITQSQFLKLHNFLLKTKLIAHQGRYGFSRRLQNMGPKFIRMLPFGKIVELVQFLLNEKIVLHRKGTVQVNMLIKPLSNI